MPFAVAAGPSAPTLSCRVAAVPAKSVGAEAPPARTGRVVAEANGHDGGRHRLSSPDTACRRNAARGSP
ncbi:DUF6053 domain-containing protein [Lysobacter enzymogenes]|uniref:DUF6053 domain-containing protein n=1 Tax=Lysobacter enzymogenes TaxID=69 RepID=UPI00384B43DE